MSRTPLESLDAAPLVEFVERNGGAGAVAFPPGPRRAYHRAKESGRITVIAADELATFLGVHPVALWGPDWTPETDIDEEREREMMREEVTCPVEGCGRTIAKQSLAVHMRAMHGQELRSLPQNGDRTLPAPVVINVPPDGLVWEAPPRGGRRGVVDVIEPLIVHLRRKPGEWARLRTFERASAGSSTATSLRKAFDDCEFKGGAHGDGSAVWGRFVGEHE